MSAKMLPKNTKSIRTRCLTWELTIGYFQKKR